MTSGEFIGRIISDHNMTAQEIAYFQRAFSGIEDAWDRGDSGALGHARKAIVRELSRLRQAERLEK